MPSRTRTFLAAASLAAAALVGVITGIPASSPAATSFGNSIRGEATTATQQSATYSKQLPTHNISVYVPATYRVRAGDTLSSISKATCGHAAHWPNLWWANRKLIKNPNNITIGWKLTVPVCGHVDSKIMHRALAAIPAPPAPKASSVQLDQSAPQPAAPQTPAASSTNVSTSGMSAFQQCVIAAESGGNPSAVNASSGAGGLYQFLPSTWAALGFSGLPENAPVSEQNAAFAKEYAQSGTSAWGPYDGC